METNRPAGILHPVSLCIVTNKADDLLLKIIDACRPAVDEILVGFDGSINDIPASMLETTGVRFIPIPWEGYSDTKNKLAAQSENEWVLSLDSDEVPDKELVASWDQIRYRTLDPSSVFQFRRLSFFEGKKISHGAWGRDRVRRLYNRNHTRWQPAAVHEELGAADGNVVYVPLPGILLHYTADNLYSFTEKSRKYAALSAIKYSGQGKKSPFWKQYLSPVFTFLKEFIFQLGFLDGKAGLQIAWINARYTYWKYQYLRNNTKPNRPEALT